MYESTILFIILNLEGKVIDAFILSPFLLVYAQIIMTVSAERVGGHGR